MINFPESVICVLRDDYENKTAAKLHLGKRTRLINTEVDVTFLFRSYESVQAMYLFYSDILNNTQEHFVISLPIFGFKYKYVVRLESQMSWSSTIGKVGKMHAKLRIINELKVMDSADFEMDINVLENKRSEKVKYWVETAGGGTIYTLGDDGYNKYNLENGGQHIYAKGSNKFYGFGISRFKIEPNDEVHNVYIYKNNKQVSAYNMFKENNELVEIRADSSAFANVTKFESFAQNALKLDYIDLFDTSNGTNFAYFLHYCRELSHIPLFDFSMGENFNSAFYGIRNVKRLPPFKFPNATYTRGIFNGMYLDGKQPAFYFPKTTSLTYAFNMPDQAGDIELDITVDKRCWFGHCFSGVKGKLKVTMNTPAGSVYRMFEGVKTEGCLAGKLWTDVDTDNKEDMFTNSNFSTPDDDIKDALMSENGSVWEKDNC